MVVDALCGRHLSALIADGHSDEFISRMDAQLGQIAGAFGTRPVVYRTMDFRSNEFRGLTRQDQTSATRLPHWGGAATGGP